MPQVASSSPVAFERSRAWWWAQHANPLQRLTPRELKHLGQRELALLAAVCGMSGHERKWVSAPYRLLAARAGVRYQRVGYVVGRLLAMGMVERRVRRRLRGVAAIERVVEEAPNRYGTDVWLRPCASVLGRPDPQHAMVYAAPTPPLRAALVQRAGWGGWRPGAGRPRKHPRQEIKFEGGAPSQAIRALETIGYFQPTGKSSSSVLPECSSSNYLPSSSLREEAPRVRGGSASLASQSEANMPEPPEEAVDLATLLVRLDNIADQKATNPSLLVFHVEHVDLPSIDPPEQDGTRPISLNPALPDEARVLLMLEAYRQACALVYGKPSGVWLRGDVTRSKSYPTLVKAAAALVEHEVAPLAWAHWKLTGAKQRGATAPIPLWSVYVLGQLHSAKMRGIFHRTYDGPSGTRLKVTRAHEEQLFRRREADALGRGLPPEGALMGCPPWYATMRRDEVRQGWTDPLGMYPRILKGSR